MKKTFLIIFFYLLQVNVYCQNKDIHYFFRDSTNLKECKQKYFNKEDSLILLYRIGNGIKNLLVVSYTDSVLKKGIVITHDFKKIRQVNPDALNRVKSKSIVENIFSCIDTDNIPCCDIPFYLIVTIDKNNKPIKSEYFLRSKSSPSCNQLILGLTKMLYSR